MFVIIYQKSTDSVKAQAVGEELVIQGGKWLVDTDPDTGEVSRYEELDIALSRVQDIRKKGGEACLTVIIE